ncbi:MULTISPECIES: hypothetical protein [Bacillus]|uniref:hypothetical protein n=1 Tax=Bacillus TaxID=1386 RepID=UPI000D026494|nr:MULTISPECIES: hypothetical protein [Bacillus]MCP1148045.1 hypothetical protein [Bacillus sp. 1735sda2]MCY7627731.1 hypothetical protein [Bacillus altitudinis]MDX2363611.1 hypothetical protein [Bacillus altitudinis]PRS77175.1 hypothetical protein C6Y03_00940 [Bacillus sp. LNXM65]
MNLTMTLSSKKTDKQESLGFPLFKKLIVDDLVSDYGFNKYEATEIVFSDKVSSKIDSDIEWAQHMGTEYWAKQINRYFN